jgi:TPR repeat protein
MKRILSLIILSISINFVWAGIYEDGLAAYQAKNFELALQKFKISSEEGNPNAQVYLGLMYVRGDGLHHRHGGVDVKG